jgi:protein-disulfide isomerase
MNKLRPQLDTRDHLRGSLSAAVAVVEFGDYECPFCGRAYVVEKQLERLLGDRLCFAFRNFPNAAIHPHAVLAAAAAEAAAAQGAFWRMHDLLFENQHALTDWDLEGYAEQLGLDLDRFAIDVRSSDVAAKIRADLHAGAISGVQGTPTFFINGRRHDGVSDLDSLLEAIEGEARAIRP